jgi:xylulokinase
MNILDIRKKTWNQALLDVVAPNLREKLDEPVLTGKVGLIASYWCQKYGFSSHCEVHVCSGDNPCSLVGLGLNRAGDVGISLGTSDVLFGVTNSPKPSAEEGSILIHPQNENNYMMMLVYKNGATTRKHIRDSVHQDDKNWSKFNESIKKTSVGCNRRIGFYFIEKEITPNISNSGILKFDENDKLVSDLSLKDEDCRMIIESQVMSYKYHAQKLGLSRISSILVTGLVESKNIHLI